ncbi:MAG: type II toxin-antitoxin system prevent-host-death family antitoxin [Rhodospirillales bacterium]|nr:type II toxin-antitoxin system prevent-host-death family antitoxin [Rhodospirillales bacterium]
MANPILREFPKTALLRNAGDVYEAVQEGPVSLSDRGTPRFVLMTRRDYDRSIAARDVRVSRRTADIPADEKEDLIRALQESILKDA